MNKPHLLSAAVRERGAKGAKALAGRDRIGGPERRTTKRGGAMPNERLVAGKKRRQGSSSGPALDAGPPPPAQARVVQTIPAAPHVWPATCVRFAARRHGDGARSTGATPRLFWKPLRREGVGFFVHGKRMFAPLSRSGHARATDSDFSPDFFTNTGLVFSTHDIHRRPERL